MKHSKVVGQYWHQRIGHQRDWVWRGWQTRYTYLRSKQNNGVAQPPLIFLHGFGAAIEHWRNNLPVFSQKHTVYALDLLGFGASRKVATNYSINLWVEQVYDFWQTFIGEPVVLVGNSIGSLVCLVAAANHPEMVKAIVMLSLPDVSLRQKLMPQWLLPIVTGIENIVASPLLLTALFQILRRPSVIRRWLGVAYSDRQAITAELVEIIAAPAQDQGAAQTLVSLFQGSRKPKFAPPVTSILPNLDIPMLLIWGLKDRMVPPSLAKAFAQLNPQIDLIELENVGHCPHDECPEKFNQILSSWLAKIPVKIKSGN